MEAERRNSKKGGKRNSPKPPDGGWGWAVVFASFMVHVIADGVAYTFGLFFVEISKDLGESKSATSWIASIMAGMTYGSGPIAGAFVNKFGCRAVSIVGSILAAVGFGLGYFAKSLLFLYLTIGVIGGLGLGFIYLPAIVSVTTYFEQKRAFATGIAVCGSGFGTFLLTPVTENLIGEYQWRGALLVISAIILHCVLFSFMFRPLTEEPEDEEQTLDAPHEGTKELLPEEEAKYLFKNSQESNESRMPLLASPVGDVAEVIKNSELSIREKMIGETKSVPLKFLLAPAKSDTLTMSSSQPVFPVGLGMGSNESINKFNGPPGARRSKMPSFGSEIGFQSADQKNRKIPTTSVPMGLMVKRKDIFYSGSLCRIPELKDEPMVSLAETVIRTPEESLSQIIERKYCGCIPIPNEFIEAIKTMMDFSMLKDPVFLFFAFSNFFTSIGYNVPYIYLVDMALENPENGKEETSFLLAIIGISNTLSRVILGYLSDKEWVNRLYLYNTALAVCGIATALSTATLDLNYLRSYSAIFGASVGVYVSLTSVILVDLLGLDKLTNAFGLLLCFQGVATVIGPPIVGLLYDEFKDYRYGFYLAGGMMAFSGLMLFFIPLVKKYSLRERTKMNMNKEDHIIIKAKAKHGKIHNNNIEV